MIKTISVLDSESLNLLANINDYESFILKRKFYDIGSFTLHININKKHVDKLQKDNIIMFDNNGQKCGIIRNKFISVSDDGIEVLQVTGHTLNHLMERRVIEPTDSNYDSQEGLQEYIMKQFVKNNFIETRDSRKLYNLELAPLKNLGEKDKWRGNMEDTVASKLKEIGEFANLGWSVYFDIKRKKFIFDVLKGRDFTENSKIKKVIFSSSFNNIKPESYTVESTNERNILFGSNNKNLVQEFGEATGIKRYEGFVKVNDAQTLEELKIAINREKVNFKSLEQLESKIINTGMYKFEVDYNIGDYITLKIPNWNIKMDSQITEVVETVDENGYSIEPIIGDYLPTILDKIIN